MAKILIKGSWREDLDADEKNALADLETAAGGMCRPYTAALYRIIDARVNPVRNYPRATITALVDKGWLRLLDGHKFEVL